MGNDFSKVMSGISDINIQCHPQELFRLNAMPPVEETLGAVSSYGFQLFLTGYSRMIFKKELDIGSATGRQLVQDMRSLKSNPRMLSNHKLKGSIDTWSANGRFYRMDYRVCSGQILIFNIQPLDFIQKSRDLAEKPCLYEVVKNGEGSWELKGKLDGAKAGYGAVNGQSNNLTKATWLMGAHLQREFGEQVKEYTLFHNPSVGWKGDSWESFRDKLGITTPVTKIFAEKLLAAQQAGNAIKWVAHSQGGVIFAEAVRNIVKNNRTEKGVLDRQLVAMHSNANNNFRSRFIFEKAGVTVLPSRANDFDFVYVVLGVNSLNPWRWIGSAVYLNHVVGGSANQSPHTLPHTSQEAWDQEMTSGPGRGRNAIQIGFNTIDRAGRKLIANHLK